MTKRGASARARATERLRRACAGHACAGSRRGSSRSDDPTVPRPREHHPLTLSLQVREKRCKTGVSHPGISLWKVWRSSSGPSDVREHAHRAELRAAGCAGARRRERPASSSRCATSASRRSAAAASWSTCAPPSGSGTMPSITPQLEAVRGVRLERRRGLLRLRRVAPEDRGAALGRDHRVDRVLLHQHAVGDGDRDRAARAALADHDGDGRDAEPRASRPVTGRSRRPARAARPRSPDRRRACRRA